MVSSTVNENRMPLVSDASLDGNLLGNFLERDFRGPIQLGDRALINQVQAMEQRLGAGMAESDAIADIFLERSVNSRFDQGLAGSLSSLEGAALTEEDSDSLTGANTLTSDDDLLLNGGQIGETLSDFFNLIDGGLATLVPQINLPIVGEIIDDVSVGEIDFESIGAVVLQQLSSLGTDFASRELIQKINTIPGLNAAVSSETSEQISLSLNFQESFQKEVALFGEGGELSSFITIPDEFDSDILLDVEYQLANVQLDIRRDGISIDRSSSTFDINVGFDLPDTTLAGLKLGFLDVEFTEPQGGNDFSMGVEVDLNDFSYEFDRSDFSTVDLFSFNAAVPEGVIDVPGIGEIRFGFPEISGSVQLDLTALDPNADLDFGFPFKISDVTLDTSSLGNLIDPFLDPIQALIQPLREVADILYAPIPIINDLANSVPALLNTLDRGGNINGQVEISLRDILEIAAEAKGIDVNFEFFDQGLQVVDLAGEFQVSEGLINLGDLSFYQGSFEQQANQTANQTVSAILPSGLPAGFNSPLLEDPVQSVFVGVFSFSPCLSGHV